MIEWFVSDEFEKMWEESLLALV